MKIIAITKVLKIVKISRKNAKSCDEQLGVGCMVLELIQKRKSVEFYFFTMYVEILRHKA